MAKKEVKLPKVARTWRQRLILLAHGVNLGLRGTGYQVRLRKSDCLVENEDGVFIYRARSLNAAVNWLNNKQGI